MGMNVDNCPLCGRMYVKNIKGMCPNCVKETELQYEKCVKYLREHRGCTIHELSEQTEVSVKQITRFIREGRISIANHANMSIACEVCGTPIRENTMCESCRQRLARDINSLKNDANRQAEEKEQLNYKSFNVREQLKDRRLD